MKETEARFQNGPVTVMRLMGGLGNQMFQYAFGRRIGVETEVCVKFDLDSGFKNDGYGRRYALGVFNTEIVRATSAEIPVGMAWTSPWHRAARTVWSLIPRRLRRVVYEESPFRCDSSVLRKLSVPAYYFGYWQNEGYFGVVRDLLRQEFTLSGPSSQAVAALREEIAGCRSVSFHIRYNHGIGADGKVIEKAREYHGACSAKYFQDGLDVIGRKPGTVCYVFSDNVDWAKANLKLPVPCRYVSEICNCTDAEELLLMASCEHHVIANSSFSWWGAWLGRNPKRVVVAPRIWMQGLAEGAVEICPKSWIRI